MKTSPDRPGLTAPLLALALTLFRLSASGAPQAGQKPPSEIGSAAKPLVAELRRALADRDEARVRVAVARIVTAYGEWAGIPDTPVRYARPVTRTAPSSDTLLEALKACASSTANRLPWRGNPRAEPGLMDAGLRVCADPVSGYAKLALLIPSEKAAYTALAREGAEYLLRTQRPSGFFPFPDLRGRNAQFGPMIERLVREHPGSIADGWVIDDGGSGDLKYDTAFCGVALTDVWRLTGDPRYLEAAKLAARWAAQQPLVANWNYNAFSAWLLGEVARETQDPALVEAAVEHAFIGILPGMMPNGRWFDSHNARLVYHGILLRGLMSTWRAMPADHPRRAELRRAIDLALSNACSEIRTRGASSVTTTTEALGLALLTFGADASWSEAASININAALATGHGSRSGDAAGPGFYLVNALAWRLEATASAHPGIGTPSLEYSKPKG